ncbi:unnamed protein product [Rhizoctonia solani]|uniref:Uncharacterized protein n=1 Tax=Rhizoctonia solani TaxID=456999 RepID=A0A8H2X0K1_9AGAM
MSPVFKSQSVPCTINYNDDDQLLSIIVQHGSVTGDYNDYTISQLIRTISGTMYPFTPTLIYNNPSYFKNPATERGL